MLCDLKSIVTDFVKCAKKKKKKKVQFWLMSQGFIQSQPVMQSWYSGMISMSWSRSSLLKAAQSCTPLFEVLPVPEHHFILIKPYFPTNDLSEAFIHQVSK